ncbi:NAD(P)-binding domain-containing protein [Kitasatospora sp. NBC_01287]|uniref:NADPH-dependent F420 reductase n=1 Tax=Kitasatospora sp. NBC_01287 TaxID=2903573 RepID=UPI002250341D|nr:NAD(P)-binding domain-containing protein [Kitasatospora sp. NBC_01287]MCX4744516.1 NAD(P)-binding domain-containing protein [Kitasatospora sp. NBC_01287]
MATLGLIGSGNIGGTLARLAVNAGLDVVLSNSRGPETLAQLVAELGPRARAATPAQAAEAGDWVVVTIPLKNAFQLPAAPLAGRIVLDTGNYYPDRDGHFARLDSGEATSSELVQEHLADSKVVKVFNNIYFGHLLDLARPSGAPDRSALPIAGDDAAAKERATTLLDTLGYDAVDAGPLAASWRFQPGTPAYGLPYLKDPAARLDQDPGQPADTATIEQALAAATR